MSDTPMPTYTVRRRRGPIFIDGRLDEPDWAAAEALAIEQFLDSARRRDVRTTVRLLWDDWTLYLAYHSADRHIAARCTQHNQMVWEDTCVEFFVSPEANNPANYYTWEINCVGVSLNKCCCDFWGHDPLAWRPADAIATSVPAPVKEPADDDHEWICEVAIPFSNFALSPVAVPPKAGDVWRANFQQCAGSGSHLATWSPLPAGCGSFHTPGAFGRLVFSEEPVR